MNELISSLRFEEWFYHTRSDVMRSRFTQEKGR